MYEGLSFDLENIVRGLKLGDGIIIENKPGHIIERSMGYVYEITTSYLRLAPGRNPSFFLERLSQWRASFARHHYKYINQIRIVDPILR